MIVVVGVVERRVTQALRIMDSDCGLSRILSRKQASV